MTRGQPGIQTSMFEVFEQAEAEARTAHLPGTPEAAAEHLLGLFRQLHAAILAGDDDAVARFESEAEDLAIKINGGERFGMCAPGGGASVLEQLTDAPGGQIPLWGQRGSFEIEVQGCRVRVDFDGIYGICFPSFAAHAIEWDKPFMSETGYRSFLGYARGYEPGATPDSYARACIEAYIAADL